MARHGSHGTIRAVHARTPQATPTETHAALVGCSALAELPGHVLDALAAEVTWVQCAAGETVTRQGEESDCLFVIASGRLQAAAELPNGGELPLAELVAGQCAGEIGLLTGVRRTTTLRAVGDALLLKVSAAAFRRLELAYPELADHFGQVATTRLRQNELAVALRCSEVFGLLDAAVLADLEQELESVSITGGSVLFREGEPGDCLYLIARGRLRVVRQARGPETGYTAELGPGECVGELALMTGEPRTATVAAVRDSHLGRLTCGAFDRLLQRHPVTLLRTIGSASVRRLIGTAAGRPPRVTGARTLAVLPVAPDVPLAAFCAALTRALATIAPTLHISSPKLDALLDQPDVSQLEEGHPSSVRVQAWLAEQELTHSLILYEADSTSSAWTSHCVHQADHLLLVGQADADPSPGPLEGWLAGTQGARPAAGQSLVLLHSTDQVPGGTTRWLAERQVQRHHHVRLSSSHDVDRLGRALTGTGVGLVLGGGGARGFAHAGVIRALHEAGVPIDAVGGTSVGAVFGAECALGWSYQQMIAETAAIANGVADPTFPIVSLIAGRRAGRALIERIGDLQIEDLWLPFFCVSATLSRGVAIGHHSGSRAAAVIASTPAPGIYPPVVTNGDLLVDGALVDNLPVETMSSFLGGGSIIAVDVSPRVDLTSNADFGLGLSGWRVLWSRLNPFMPRLKVPTILEILMRTTELGSIRQQDAAARAANLYLRPPVERYRLFDYQRGPAIAEVAYRATRDQIAAWAVEREPSASHLIAGQAGA
jgi:lysophospholipid hydrolase